MLTVCERPSIRRPLADPSGSTSYTLSPWTRSARPGARMSAPCWCPCTRRSSSHSARGRRYILGQREVPQLQREISFFFFFSLPAGKGKRKGVDCAHLTLPESSTAVYGWHPEAMWSLGLNFSIAAPFVPDWTLVVMGLRESWATVARGRRATGPGAGAPSTAPARAITVKQLLANIVGLFCISFGRSDKNFGCVEDVEEGGDEQECGITCSTWARGRKPGP